MTIKLNRWFEWLWLNIWFPFKFHFLLGGYLGCEIDQLKYLDKCFSDLNKKLEVLKTQLRRIENRRRDVR